jgi:cytosine/adenosine deaminase-related metal-dependent hydrolase
MIVLSFVSSRNARSARLDPAISKRLYRPVSGAVNKEAISAETANAAYALRQPVTIGSLERRKKMDMLLCDVSDSLSFISELAGTRS